MEIRKGRTDFIKKFPPWDNEGGAFENKMVFIFYVIPHAKRAYSLLLLKVLVSPFFNHEGVVRETYFGQNLPFFVVTDFIQIFCPTNFRFQKRISS